MFQEFAHFFGPEDLDAMSAAFDGAWYQLCIAGLVANSLQIATTKKKLAQIILSAATTGERSRERLQDIALRSLQPHKIRSTTKL